MNITFIGNCQTATLCFYFQKLMGECGIKWVLYGTEMEPHLGEWIDKVKNKVLNFDLAFDVIKNSDVIIYQEIVKEKSQFSNAETLQALKKESCILIKIPSIHLEYSKYDTSIKELQHREIENKVDLRVSDIFEKYRGRTLMLTFCHPNTFLFLEVVSEICKILHIDTFSNIQRDMFLQDNNYMKLP